MLAHLRPALVLLLLLSALTGIAYPLAMTGIGQVLFPAAANGSLIEREGKIVGSALIGQSFTGQHYFWPRPSATSAPDPADPTRTVSAPYNAGASSGSNKGPTAKVLLERIGADVARLEKQAGGKPLPADSITASGSGLDPHISPAYAALQAARVAAARGLAPAQVAALVARHTEGRTFGVLGEPRVNVLRLNLALDAAGR
ncbi:MAG: potassium-transporting ATPase subunit KdpC [Alphaproteobacteria bacterium]